MSLLIRRLSRLGLGKDGSVRSSLLILSKGFSSSLLQTRPCSILGAKDCGEGLGTLAIINAIFNVDEPCAYLEKKVPMDLVYNRRYDHRVVTIGASHGWVATMKKEDGILRLQDDLNPYASDTDPKRIPLPPIVSLPRCQTEIITNVSMSSSSPEDKSCLVAVKFLGPQLSICRPARPKSKWINIKIEHPCFFSSRVMFSKKDNVFRIPGSGGHLIASWDLEKEYIHKPKLQRLRFQNLPELTKTKRELLDSCCTTAHLVESHSTGETFLLKWYKKTGEINNGIVNMTTEAIMVFKLDEQGNAIFTENIGDLCIFLSKSEPFCVPASSFPGMLSNCLIVLDVDEIAFVNVPDEFPIISKFSDYSTPYMIPPQNIIT